MIRVVLATCFALIAVPAAAIDIKEVTSPGGIKAWLVEEASIPFTALEIRFKGGASLDVDGKRGAAYLMSGLLDEGALIIIESFKRNAGVLKHLVCHFIVLYCYCWRK